MLFCSDSLFGFTVREIESYDQPMARRDPVRRAAQMALDAYDRYIDTDELDPLAEAMGQLRDALMEDVVKPKRGLPEGNPRLG